VIRPSQRTFQPLPRTRRGPNLHEEGLQIILASFGRVGILRTDKATALTCDCFVSIPEGVTRPAGLIPYKSSISRQIKPPNG